MLKGHGPLMVLTQAPDDKGLKQPWPDRPRSLSYRGGEDISILGHDIYP